VSGRLAGSLSNQAFDCWRGLGTNAFPVSQAVLCDADALFIGSGNRVVKTDPLYEASVTPSTLVGNDNIEKRARFCTATGESDDDYNLSFG